MLTEAISGTTKVLNAKEMKDDNGAVIGSDITPNEHVWSMVATNAATLIAASIFTRKRVAAGREPIMGYIL
jgi:hypothetical protein